MNGFSLFDLVHYVLLGAVVYVLVTELRGFALLCRGGRERAMAAAAFLGALALGLAVYHLAIVPHLAAVMAQADLEGGLAGVFLLVVAVYAAIGAVDRVAERLADGRARLAAKGATTGAFVAFASVLFL